MTALRLDDLRQYSDVLRLRTRRAVDAALRRAARRGRAAELFPRALGALPLQPLPRRRQRAAAEPARALHPCRRGRPLQRDRDHVDRWGRHHRRRGALRTSIPIQASFEFGLSVDDRWQGHGIGAALLRNLECRAAAFGAKQLFGDTLRSNEAMMALARKSGFAFSDSPGDWRLVRFEKQIDVGPQDIPCASWRLAAQRIALPRPFERGHG